MSQRDMTYDLDGVFASRNQGQLVTAQTTQQSVVRTPGLVPVRRTLMGYATAPQYAGTGGWLDSSSTLPLLGTVSNKTLLLGAAGVVGAIALFFALRKKG